MIRYYCCMNDKVIVGGGGEVYEPGVYITTLQLYCTAEYTLTAMLAGTYSVALVPELQGAIVVFPNASPPIAIRLVGMLTLVRLVQL